MAIVVPYLIVNGKKITMPKPKIKLWRELVEFGEKHKNGELEGMDVFDAMIDIVTDAFNHPDITKEVIEENLDMDDLNAIYMHIKTQVEGIAILKSQQFPNVKTPAGKRRR